MLASTSESLTHRQKIAAVALAALAGATRFIPLSIGPWDWDEVLFCLAIGEYDVSTHQPHPLGFPLFILLGRIARLVIDSDFRALQAVNIVAGLLAFPVMFWTARAFRFSFIPALAAALLFAFLPNVWFYGGTALSDLTGAVLFLAAVAAYVHRPGSVRWYLVASAIFGAAILFRPQNALVVVFPWTVASVRLLRERKFRGLLGGVAIVSIIAAGGYLIAAAATGMQQYLRTVAGHSEYVKREAMLNPHRPPLLVLFATFLDPYYAGKISVLINALALLGIAFRTRVTLPVVLTFGPPFLFSVLALGEGGSSRFSLNYMAGIVLLAVAGIDALAGVRPRMAPVVYALLMLIILGRLVTWVWPAFEEPRKTQSPGVAAALWLRHHAPPESTIFADGSSWPWVRYFLSDFKQIRIDDMAALVSHEASAGGWYLTIQDSPADGAIVFRRPRHRIWNLVAHRSFEATVQRTGNIVAFGEGWYATESAGEGLATWRWSSGNAEMLFPLSGSMHELRLRFSVPADAMPEPVDVRFLFDGKELDRLITKEQEHDVRYVVASRADAPSVLRIVVAKPFVPALHGPSDDMRPLGVMLHEWSWRRVGE